MRKYSGRTSQKTHCALLRPICQHCLNGSEHVKRLRGKNAVFLLLSVVVYTLTTKF
jgi:hypothetical protein